MTQSANACCANAPPPDSMQTPINQLAHRANARGEATRAEIHAAAELVRQAYQSVQEAV